MVHIGLAPLLLAALSATVAGRFVPGAFILEFEDDQNRDDVLSSVRENGQIRMDLDFELFKGISVQMHDVNSHEVVGELAALPAVKNVWPVRLYDIPRTQFHSAGMPSGADTLLTRDNLAADTFEPHVMTQVDKLRAKGYTGKGVHVAVIDTGIDYLHPALGGCFGGGCLVTNGYDLVGDAYTGSNDPVPGNDPMDCAGHGTHVAGIIAARENQLGFTGAAPGVSLGAYRVFGCTGSVSTDVLIAAMNRAYGDGANIITMSIGGPSGWKEDPWAVTASRIVHKGVPVTISAGNEGDEGIFYASSGSSGEGVAAIAAFENLVTPVIEHYGNATTGRGNGSQEFTYTLGTPGTFDITLPLWATSLDTSTPADACSPLPDDTPDLSPYVVLIRRGTCFFSEKVTNVAAKGARYILTYNNIDGPPIFLSLAGEVPPTVKGVGFVDKETGEAWVAQLKAGQKVVVTLGDLFDKKLGFRNVPNPTTGGALTYFTTWGPTWQMDVKPQFGAPGGSILSTFPRSMGSYAVLSGTSMSCPLTAAIHALLIQVRGTSNPIVLQNLLSTTAKSQVFNDGAQFYDFLAPVPQQGAGLVQAYDAAFTTTLLEPASLSFNETTYFARNKRFTLTNHGSDEVTYLISYTPAMTTISLKQGADSINPFPGEFDKASATLTFSETKVTLRRGGRATVRVQATPPALSGARLPVWSGYVRINGSDGTALSLPYQGLVGSLHNHTVLDKNATWIARADDPNLAAVAANTVFTIPRPGSSGKGNTTALVLPAVVYAPVLGSPVYRFYAVPVSRNGTCEKPLGELSDSPLRWVSRATDSLNWNGTLTHGKHAPEGTYKIVVKALRLYGNEKVKKDWDKSVTLPFIIKYA